MSARTPTPWRWATYGRLLGRDHQEVLRPIEQAYDGPQIEGSPEDIQFLLTACNAYDADQALIAELASILHRLLNHQAKLPYDVYSWTEDDYRAARSALSRVDRVEKEGA